MGKGLQFRSRMCGAYLNCLSLVAAVALLSGCKDHSSTSPNASNLSKGSISLIEIGGDEYTRLEYSGGGISVEANVCSSWIESNGGSIAFDIDGVWVGDTLYRVGSADKIVIDCQGSLKKYSAGEEL